MSLKLKKLKKFTPGGAIDPTSVFYGVDENDQSVFYTGQQLIDLGFAPDPTGKTIGDSIRVNAAQDAYEFFTPGAGGGFPSFINTAYVNPAPLGTSDGGADLIFDTIANALAHIDATTPSTSNRWLVIVYSRTDPGIITIGNFIDFIAYTTCVIIGPVSWIAATFNFSTIFFHDTPHMTRFLFTGQITQTAPGVGSAGDLIDCDVTGGLTQVNLAVLNMENCVVAHFGVGTWQFAELLMRGGLLGSAAGTMPIDLANSSRFVRTDVFGIIDFFSSSSGNSPIFEHVKFLFGSIIRPRDQINNSGRMDFTDCDDLVLELFRAVGAKFKGTFVDSLTIDSAYTGALIVNAGCTFNNVIDNVSGGVNASFNGHVFLSEEQSIGTTSTVRGTTQGAVLDILGALTDNTLWNSMTIVRSAANGTEITINKEGIYEITFPIETKVSADFHAMLSRDNQSAPGSAGLAVLVLDTIFKVSNATVTYYNFRYTGKFVLNNVIRVNVIDAAGKEPDDAGRFTIRRIA